MGRACSQPASQESQCSQDSYLWPQTPPQGMPNHPTLSAAPAILPVASNPAFSTASTSSAGEQLSPYCTSAWPSVSCALARSTPGTACSAPSTAAEQARSNQSNFRRPSIQGIVGNGCYKPLASSLPPEDAGGGNQVPRHSLAAQEVQDMPPTASLATLVLAAAVHSRGSPQSPADTGGACIPKTAWVVR